MNFTYCIPISDERYMKGILNELKRKKEFEIYSLLNGGSVSIKDSGTYSLYIGNCGRPDAHGVYITFSVNPNSINELEKDDITQKLKTLCNNLIDPNCGFDVKGVNYIPDLIKDWDLEGDLSIEFEGKSKNISDKVLKEFLPIDIKEKGYEMAEIYTYLYAIENSLRLFIEKVGGENLRISTPLKRSIQVRKDNENKNLWLSVRGNLDLFYLDFKDLKTIIVSNWSLFESYFPSQEFITSKIAEIAECRNKVAHNSYINVDERNLIKSYYTSILGQISKSMK
ncbi:Swt1 family HEPN domain-containing protein [Paraclostridium bifermentans]|uniref:Swt1 family HEPN domain-containing protein n=1 Tax=Paraclostridium bifermentans TaxID=1490 RepID=UPI0011DDA3EE|nr:Swt1 family HEPN domain-containing protein [Paraclostridium bifermentans]